MKPADVKSSTYIDFDVESKDKDPNLKSVIELEYQNLKTFLQKATLKIDLEKFWELKKLKTLHHRDI